ncbi:MAG: ECF transporter S component [Clostridia bacterium]|nr:ECF transporter S component [Clostridia bacterium]
MERKNIKNLVLSAMFLAMGLVLPFFTAQVKEIGNTLLPMHIPVMLCGLVCGGRYGLAVGFILPILRGAVFSMPPLYPNGVWMAFELATYGFVIGFLYRRFPKQNIRAVYGSLVAAMLAGRIVWGIVKTIVLGLGGELFPFQAFIAGGLLDAIPGIILQLVLIPAIMGFVVQAKKK